MQKERRTEIPILFFYQLRHLFGVPWRYSGNLVDILHDYIHLRGYNPCFLIPLCSLIEDKGLFICEGHRCHNFGEDEVQTLLVELEVQVKRAIPGSQHLGMRIANEPGCRYRG